MTDSRLARRPQPASPARRVFGSLPDSQTGMELDAALELAGVDRTELALLASTTFKEARSLEELVTLISATRRRGLDAMLKHVYFERFGGQNSDPSMHVAIDGLRAIAAGTGRYGGRSEPRFSGVFDMKLDDDGHTKPVPEKCTMTVYAIVQNRSCAFEGVAFMEESYPGTGGRGRMWRERPRGMLAIAAERQALRSAFPGETAGLGDHDDVEPEEAPAPRTRTVTENAAEHARIFDQPDEPPARPAKRERPLADLVAHYNQRLGEIVGKGLIPPEDREQWELQTEPTREVVLDKGLKLLELEQLVNAQESPTPERSAPAAELTTPPPPVTVRSALGQRLADLNEDAARLEVDYSDCQAIFPAVEEDVIRRIERLEERVQARKDQLAGVAEPMTAQGRFG